MSTMFTVHIDRLVLPGQEHDVDVTAGRGTTFHLVAAALGAAGWDSPDIEGHVRRILDLTLPYTGGGFDVSKSDWSTARGYVRVQAITDAVTRHDVDEHGNRMAVEGVTRCVCGSKYWEFDRCVDCQSYPAP